MDGTEPSTRVPADERLPDSPDNLRPEPQQEPPLPEPVSGEAQIPVLDEVITGDDAQMSDGNRHTGAESDSGTGAGARQIEQTPAADDPVILAYQLRSQLTDELQDLIQTAVKAAIEQTLDDLETNLYQEISASLESRLDQLIVSLLDDPN